MATSSDPHSGHRQPRRRNRASLAAVEARVLRWMAVRLPNWITPDVLTVIGLFAAVLIAASYLLSALHLNFIWLASSGFVLHWWGDSLDGTLARVRKIERPKYGFFVDHYADALSTVIICAGLGLSPLLDLHVALALIIGYLLLMIHAYLTSLARGLFQISMGGIGPTEVRIGIVIANTAVWALGNPVIAPFGVPVTLFTLLGVLVAAGFGIFFLVFGLIERNRLARIDRPKSPGAPAGPAPERGRMNEQRNGKSRESSLRKVG